MAQQETPIFGIDLGTTYSCIAYVDELGQSVVVPNADGNPITPSVVLFEGETRVVGEQAKNTAVMYPDRVIQMVKRYMGSTDWRYHYNGIDYSPEEVSSFILRKLVKDASEQVGYPIVDVVITCPAYFGIAQREATARAGEIAGLNVLEIINEPTAAAIDYGLHKEQNQVVLVYDLGGGTFDITMIEIQDGSITVVATGGDHQLGGRDWDEQVVNYLAQRWMEENGSFDNPADSLDTLQELWEKAERAKKALSARVETVENVTHAGQRAAIKLTRDRFNEFTTPLLERTIQFTRATLAAAAERGHQRFDQLLLVGGSTRMPQVKEKLQEEFGIEPRLHDPDLAVAKGAAAHGQRLNIRQKVQFKVGELTGVQPEEVDLTLVASATVERAQEEVAREGSYQLPAVRKAVQQKVTNVSSHSFGIVALDPETKAEIIANLVLTNEPLPRTNTQRFRTAEANQESVELQIVETTTSEKRVDNLEEGNNLGSALLLLPEGLPAGAPIDVTCTLNEQGRLHVVGREPSSGREVEATIETRSGISQEELAEAKSRSRQVVIS